MKIVCDSCSTKYSISDDKVRGKVFKIRCKKCSHIIVVKGTTTEAAPAAPEAPTDAVWHLVVDGDQVGPLADSDVRARLLRNEISAENYVWKEGFSDWLRLAEVPEFADVVAASAPVAGELFSDSGRADATEVADRDGGEAGTAGGGLSGFFAGGNTAHAGGNTAHEEAGGPTPAVFGDGAGGFSALAASAGLSGRNRAPSTEGVPAEDDDFGGPASSEGADLFGAAVPIAGRVDSGRVRGRGANGAGGSGRHDGGRVENLTAQRSENSVLFSLSNLQSLAAPSAPTARPGTVQSTEGSGLIDIRAMAASTMKAPATGSMPSSFGGGSRSVAEDDLPAFGAFSSAAPVLLSLPSSSGPPKWVYALVAVAAVMIIAVGAAAFSILGKPVMVEPAPVAPVAVAPPEGAARPKEVKSAEPSTSKATDEGLHGKGIAAGELPPRENGEADKAAAEKGGISKGGRRAGGRGKRFAAGGGPEAKSGGGAVASAAGAAAAPSDPEKAKPAKGSLDDLLEGALNGRKGASAKPKVDDDGPGSRSTKGGGDTASAGPLSKGAVVSGMNGVKGKVSGCYAQFKVPGMAMVNVVIAKSGKVSSAAVTGKFAGTPTGTCVESAVKTASFPPSEGLTTPYPFSLR